MVFEQEIERSINGDRGRALAGCRRDAVDQIIGAERTPLARENFENAPPARSQGDAFVPAEGERGAERALAVIMRRMVMRRVILRWSLMIAERRA